MAGQGPAAGPARRSEIILGLSAYYHDSAAALLVDGRLVAAAQEERFSRKRHDAAFPAQAVRYVLQEAGIDLADVGTVAFYDKPLVKFERLLETYHMFAPRGLRSFFSAMPVWKSRFTDCGVLTAMTEFRLPRNELSEVCRS